MLGLFWSKNELGSWAQNTLGITFVWKEKSTNVRNPKKQKKIAIYPCSTIVVQVILEKNPLKNNEYTEELF